MGLCLGSIGSSIACCFGQAACSLCCSSLPACKNSTSTRIVYGIFLLLGLITSCIMLSPGLESTLTKIPALCTNSSFKNIIMTPIDCKKMVGYLAVYRLSFGMTLFFVVFTLLMIKVKSSSDFRSKIQNGFWAFKFLLLVGLIASAFFIPNGGFAQTWMIFGMIGGFLFIIVQLILSIDFIHTWNEAWVEQVDNGSRKHGIGLLFFTFFFYSLSLVGIILFYIYYAHDKKICQLHVFFISFNMILCVIISIISILPCIREYNASIGLLQSSFVTAYVTYYTWSAMSNNPNHLCNPSLRSIIHNNQTSPTTDGVQKAFDPITILGLVMFFLCLLYSILTTSNNNRARKLFLSPSSSDSIILDDSQLLNSTTDVRIKAGDNDGQRVYDDETTAVSYNYSLFHFMFALATLTFVRLTIMLLQCGLRLHQVGYVFYFIFGRV
ncbi:unnamed protein product [Didymodactylos carnosus]|uniref:Serine incorporator n=1 Tax=Didymodactylos carnosus TaxID=1234261 RepID=A0A813UBX5_9BILA|nr:unnamed protein product [Didymodactylos carnosus]CAF3610799.1 unnamed protein product [Didymodactylos carnosus]